MKKNLNKIIPDLIILCNQYNKNLNNRIKADSIILSLDEDANSTFNKFIKLSNIRLREMKSGGKLNNIILKQQPSYTNIKNDIQKDIIYKTEYITTEKKKLCKSVNHFCIKKINKLNGKLIDSLIPKTKIDLKEINKLRTIKNSERLLNFVKNKNIKKHPFDSNFSSKKKLSPTENEKGILNISLNEELNEDYERLSNGIRSYQNILSDFKKNVNFDNNNFRKMKQDKILKIYQNRLKDIEPHLDVNHIKFLSYDENQNKKHKKKEKIDEIFNINNLTKIKRFHQNLKYNINKNKSRNTNTNINLNNNNQSKNTFSTTTMKNYFSQHSIYSNRKVLSEDNIKTNTNFNISNSDYNFSENQFFNPELKNTIKLIKLESEKETSNNFENKIEKFNQCFNKYFPTIEISSKRKKLKLAKKKKCQSEKNFISNFGNNKNYNITQNDHKHRKKEKIIECFRKIYEEKLKKWRKERNKMITDKQINLKQNEELMMFLINNNNKNLSKNK